MRVGRQMVEAILVHQKISREEAREHAISLLGKVGLPEPEKVFKRYPHTMSGGQRQRLTIARALVGHPDILILDDSASALDYATDAALRKALRTLPAETTLFIVSQRTSSLRHADQIIVLDDGHVVGIGTHDALMQTCEVYREIHESQFRKGSDVQ